MREKILTRVDYIVLLIYLTGIFSVGLVFAARNRNSNDMFAAGGESPWWTSGLSAFMTMFSAGTFVVWGGIAYKHGLVAVSINLMYGVAALLVGYFVAGQWKKMGVRTPAEYVRLRFGEGALHFYTWSMTVFRMVSVAVALYALAVMLTALMPLAEGNPFRDGTTGNLSLFWAILLFGGIVVTYTMLGGLWAVLMTDVLQFIVLNLAVLFVVPLMFLNVGGVSGFVESAPEGFLALTGGGYSYYFLAGWLAIHFFMIGAEWAFVQRFICVPTSKDAQKSTYLFGILYLASPLLWLLPPMIWRIQHPIPTGATDAEIDTMANQAYILACRDVLPAGMVGLMLAAMFSATASMVSSQLNVFAGVLTHDMYRRLIRPDSSEKHLLWAGRSFTVLLGIILMAVALTVDRMGGAEKVVISVTSLMVGPLLAPTLWGLFSKRVSAAGVWVTAAVCMTLGVMVKFGLPTIVTTDDHMLASLSAWVEAESKTVELLLGVVLPLLILSVLEWTHVGESVGAERINALEAAEVAACKPVAHASSLPAVIVAVALAFCGCMLTWLAVIDHEERTLLGGFALAMFVIAGLIAGGTAYLKSRRLRASSSDSMQWKVKHAEGGSTT